MLYKPKILQDVIYEPGIFIQDMMIIFQEIIEHPLFQMIPRNGPKYVLNFNNDIWFGYWLSKSWILLNWSDVKTWIFFLMTYFHNKRKVSNYLYHKGACQLNALQLNKSMHIWKNCIFMKSISKWAHELKYVFITH